MQGVAISIYPTGDVSATKSFEDIPQTFDCGFAPIPFNQFVKSPMEPASIGMQDLRITQQHDLFSRVCNEACEELAGLDPKLVDDFVLEEKTYTIAALGTEISKHIRTDKIFRLLRLDPLRTVIRLNNDEQFRRLIFRTILFNVSRDAAMRLKARELSPEIIHKELVPLFEEVKNLYSEYVSGAFQPMSSYDIHIRVKCYMLLVSLNLFFGHEKHGLALDTITLKEYVEDSSENKTFQACLSMMKQYAIMQYFCEKPDSPKFYFIPTFSNISTTTLMKAWHLGIFFFQTSSKVFVKAHDTEKLTDWVFIHDELHALSYLHKIKRYLAKNQCSLEEFLRRVHQNVEILENHLKTLKSDSDPIKRALGLHLECFMFIAIHENGELLLKDNIQTDDWATSEFTLYPPEEKKYSDVTREGLIQARNYLLEFSSSHFN